MIYFLVHTRGNSVPVWLNEMSFKWNELMQLNWNSYQSIRSRWPFKIIDLFGWHQFICLKIRSILVWFNFSRVPSVHLHFNWIELNIDWFSIELYLLQSFCRHFVSYILPWHIVIFVLFTFEISNFEYFGHTCIFVYTIIVECANSFWRYIFFYK